MLGDGPEKCWEYVLGKGLTMRSDKNAQALRAGALLFKRAPCVLQTLSMHMFQTLFRYIPHHFSIRNNAWAKLNLNTQAH